MANIAEKELLNFKPLKEEELLIRLENAREQEKRGEVFDAKTVLETMKAKYRL